MSEILIPVLYFLFIVVSFCLGGAWRQNDNPVKAKISLIIWVTDMVLVGVPLLIIGISAIKQY